MSLDRINHRTELSALVTKKLSLKEEVICLEKEAKLKRDDISKLKLEATSRMSELALKTDTFLELTLDADYSAKHSVEDLGSQYFRGQYYVAVSKLKLKKYVSDRKKQINLLEMEVSDLQRQIKLRDERNALRTSAFGMMTVVAFGLVINLFL